ncbi:hypothetical protein GJ496_003579 [Pomphorhynchus laevis]|nr:hypothetical protein GJ496_003579 [Pomphorhynchus laevis]
MAFLFREVTSEKHLDHDKALDKLLEFCKLKASILTTFDDESANYGMFSLSTLKLRLELQDKVQTAIDIIYNLYIEDLGESIGQLQDEFARIKAELLEKPIAIEDYEQKRIWIAQLHLNINVLEQKIEELIEKCLKSHLSGKELDTKFEEAIVRLSASPIVIKRVIDHTLKQIDSDTTELKRSHRRDAKLLSERIEIAKANLIVLMSEFDENKASDIANSCKALSDEIQELQEISNLYNKREGLLSFKEIMYANFNSMRSDLAPLTEFWTLLATWKGVLKEWNELSICNFNMSAMETCINSLKEPALLNKLLKSKNEVVVNLCDALMKEVEDKSRFYPLIESLHRIGCNPKTWTKLAETLNINLVLDRKLTPSKCVELKLFTQLQEISNFAMGLENELDVKKKVKQLDAFWTKQLIQVDSNDFLINVIIFDAELKLQIENDLIFIQSIDSGIMDKIFVESLNLWKSRLSTIQNVTTNWRICQKQIIDYSPFLQMDPQFSNVIQTIHRTWARIFNIIKENDLSFLRVCVHPRIRTGLNDCMKIMDRIRSNIISVANNASRNFTRFLFLPEHDLIELFSLPLNVTLSCKQVNICFPGIDKVNELGMSLNDIFTYENIICIRQA